MMAEAGAGGVGGGRGNPTDGRQGGGRGGEDAESCVFKADLYISVVAASGSVGDAKTKRRRDMDSTPPLPPPPNPPLTFKC